MFTTLGINNFKAWKGWHRVALKPLTLLLGTNSAGKTSLLQPLLLLQQTVGSPDRKQALNLGGQPADILHLGTMEDVLSEHDKSKVLELELSFLPTVRSKDDEERPEVPAPAGAENAEPTTFRVGYAVAPGGGPVIEHCAYARSGAVYLANRQKGNVYDLTAPGFPPPGAAASAKRAYEPERSVAFSAEAIAALGDEGAAVQDFALSLTRELQAISYLGPLRERPLRYYAWNGATPGDLGPKGELAVQVLLASANGRGPKGLLGQVSAWLARMEIADGLRLEQQGKSNVFEVRVAQGGQEANLVDVGFGISQVLPILTLAFFAPAGSTVIMEQPELHLHPLAQAHLANLLVEIARDRRLQFLIETHSEHLFRRLQFLMADKTTSEEQCALYFVTRGEDGGAKLETLAVDTYGRVANWPQKFFGDAVGEAERQMRQTLLRKKQERKGG